MADLPEIPPEVLNALLGDPAKLEAEILAIDAKESGSKSFSAFVKQAWQYVPQVDPLIWGWHMDAICLHFEEVARGGISRLLVNIAPGHAKSVMLSVLWPAWVWTWWPKCQFLFASYSAELAVRDSIRCRAVIESDWYREMHSRPGGWMLRHDQNAKGHFVNTRGGERYATGVGGTGRRAHRIGIDDPLDIEERYSKAARDRAKDWIGSTLSQRFVDAKTGCVAMIMQRLHEEDPSGFVLEGGGWEHLMLPSEFEPDRRCVTYHEVEKRNGHIERVKKELWRDPRTTDGELLFPEKFSKEVLDDFKRPNQLGPDGYAGQHGQRPRPAGGIMFQLSWWRFWKPDGVAGSVGCNRPRGCTDQPARALPQHFDQVVISVDANFKDKEDADYVSIQVIAEKGADRYVLYHVNGPFGFTKSVQAIREVKKLYKRARVVLIETAANGDAIVETLQGEISGVLGIRPEGGKEARAWAVQPQVQAGNCYLPEGAPWLDYFLEEFASFPRGRRDDSVDAFTQALNYLTTGAETTADKWRRRFSRDARA